MGCKLPWQRHLSQIQLLKKHTTKSERTKVPNTLFLAMLTKTNCALMLLVEILLKEFLNSVILKFNTVTSKSTTKTLMELTENDSFSSVGSDLTLRILVKSRPSTHLSIVKQVVKDTSVTLKSPDRDILNEAAFIEEAKRVNF